MTACAEFGMKFISWWSKLQNLMIHVIPEWCDFELILCQNIQSSQQ